MKKLLINLNKRRVFSVLTGLGLVGAVACSRADIGAGDDNAVRTSSYWPTSGIELFANPNNDPNFDTNAAIEAFVEQELQKNYCCEICEQVLIAGGLLDTVVR